MSSVFSILGLSITVIALIGFGLLLFILGLIQKKPGQWVPGIIVTFFSCIFGIFVFVYMIKSNVESHYNRMSDLDNNLRDYSSPYDQDNSNQNSDRYQRQQQPAQEVTPEETTEDQVSGFIQDADKSLIYIKITPEVALKDYGIKLEKIDTYFAKTKNKKIIPLVLNFTTKCKGDMVLLLFSSSNEELGRSKIEVNQQGNTSITMKFMFPDETNFLQATHASLKISD